MKNRKRIFALIAAILFFTCVIGCTLFILASSNHNCTGEDCAICSQVNACRTVITRMGFSVLAAGVLVAGFTMFALKSEFSEIKAGFFNPVLCKVKLTD